MVGGGAEEWEVHDSILVHIFWLSLSLIVFSFKHTQKAFVVTC